jgi:xanthine dehydrogenase YagS FAD-binding subunit
VLDGGKVASSRIVLGAVAHYPWSVPAADDFMRGKKLDADLARAAAEKAVEGAKPLRDNAHKVALVKTMVVRALLAAGGVK